MMKLNHKLLLLVLFSSLAGCSDGGTVIMNNNGDKTSENPDEKTCEDECQANKKACVDETTASVCTKNEDGCLAYKIITCPKDFSCKNGTCVDDEGENACEDECEPGSDSCTSKNKLQTCVLGENGCYQFNTVSCTDDKVCVKGSCITEPTEECENECVPEDTKCLSDAKILSCQAGVNGCYELVTKSCPERLICKDAECKEPGEPEACKDECKAGAKSCTEEGLAMVCGDFNEDGCLENQILPCDDNEHCKNGLCENNDDPPVETCTDECEKDGLTKCDGTTGVKTCGNYDSDSCLEWSEATPCKSGSACSEGKCGCTNQCDSNGKTECDSKENGFKTCADTNGDGCLEWSSVTACTKTQCQGGKCLCNHECAKNAKECSGAGFRTCTTNAESCRVWSKVTTCENGCENGDCKPDVVMKPTRYPGNQILSPVTAYSVKKMKDIAAKQSRSNVHFAKLGDSHFASDTVFMYCFASGKTQKLNGATFLQNSIDAFNSKSPNPFSRNSVSAIVGETVYGVLKSGMLEKELQAMNPRFAFIDYGSNDIEWYEYSRPEGSTGEGYFATLQWYYQEYRKALDIMLKSGVIPMIIGTGYRRDLQSYGSLSPFYFVPVFDAVGRGLAEQYQIPYMNLSYLQMQEPLKSNNYGLGGDNLHHKSYGNGCDFTDTGMKAGANARNRYALEMLDRAYRTVVQGEDAKDEPILYKGSGTKDSPYVVSSLPYTHAGNTSKGTNNYSSYSCSSKSEAGPEIYYKMTLSQATKIRAFVVSASGADADIHLLKSLDSNGCLARGNIWVEGNLAAGTYYFAIDTYGSADNAGEYLFGVTKCLSGDGLCGSKNTGG